MHQTLHNVISMNSDSVYSRIMTFINNKSKRGGTTGEEYLRDIKLFFKVMKNKEIEDLTCEDIEISLPELLEYQNILIDSGKYKNNTINRKFASLKSLYNYLKACKFNVDPMVFEGVDDLPDDTENIGYLSSDEAKLLAELAYRTEKHKPLEKKVLILLAASTSMRKSAILNIRFCNIKKHETKKDVYVIESNGKNTRLFDKSKVVKGKEIHAELYKMILQLKGNRLDTDKIFTIPASTIDLMIKRLCKRAGFDPNRNISFHSLKKAGIKWVREATNGDPVAIQAQGGWSSLAVANHYLEPEANMAGIGMFEKIDKNIFKELTREEMLELLESFGDGLGYRLYRKAKEIIEKRR